MPRSDDAADLSSRLYDLDNNDPDSVLVDRSQVSREDLNSITNVMAALGRLRDAEQLLSDASQRYMKLGRSDMRALHFLIVAQHTQTVVTPSAIAAHLGISSASTTKLLDRLEEAGHIVRAAHPSDRRALVITITDATREAAMQTVGRLHAKRFHAAARLTSTERDIVVRFLDDMTDQISLRNEAWTSETSEQRRDVPSSPE
ncbi:MAG: MarR family transcriptional regulator [Schumannella sp.]